MDYSADAHNAGDLPSESVSSRSSDESMAPLTSDAWTNASSALTPVANDRLPTATALFSSTPFPAASNLEHVSNNYPHLASDTATININFDPDALPTEALPRTVCDNPLPESFYGADPVTIQRTVALYDQQIQNGWPAGVRPVVDHRGDGDLIGKIAPGALLGSGAFKTVSEAEYRNEEINQAEEVVLATFARNRQSHLDEELRSMSLVADNIADQHRNHIIAPIGVMVDHDGLNNFQAHLVMERAAGEPMDKVAMQMRGPAVCESIAQAAEALSGLAEKNVYMPDIKPANMMVDIVSDPSKPHLTLIDYGGAYEFTRITEYRPDIPHEAHVHTLGYAPPERFGDKILDRETGELYPAGRDPDKAMTFQLGVSLMATLVTDTRPHANAEIREWIDKNPPEGGWTDEELKVRQQFGPVLRTYGGLEEIGDFDNAYKDWITHQVVAAPDLQANIESVRLHFGDDYANVVQQAVHPNPAQRPTLLEMGAMLRELNGDDNAYSQFVTLDQDIPDIIEFESPNPPAYDKRLATEDLAFAVDWETDTITPFS